MLLRLFKEDLFYTISIKKIVWGYQDPMLRLAKKFLPGWFYTDTVGFLAGVRGQTHSYTYIPALFFSL